MGEAPVHQGEVLGGKFRVDHVLGAGGMGVVVAATHLQLEQRVAIKFLREGTFQSDDTLERFLREARAAAKLKSEHVARVLDTGTFENGCPYIVMELLEGSDLAAELRRAGPLPVAAVAEYVVQACDAIAEAHALGIVHRDLKPANLFLTRRSDGSPLVKVLDFGISKSSPLGGGAEGVAMTRSGAMMGSPLYMSPEQMRSTKDVDARTDVWSLGVILYELLSGRVPFAFDNLGALIATVIMEAHIPLSRVRTDVPPELERLVERCLVKEPSQRLPNVGELAQGLAPFCPPRTLPLVDRISSVLAVSPGNAARPAPAAAKAGALAATPPGSATPVIASARAAAAASTSSGGVSPARLATLASLAAILVVSGAALALHQSTPAVARAVPPATPTVSSAPSPEPPASAWTSADAAAVAVASATPEDTASRDAGGVLAPRPTGIVGGGARPGRRPGGRTPGQVASASVAPAPSAPPPAPAPSAAKPGLLDTSD
jgi:eukaryotic-like serine/threonine-protein kinase